MRTPPRLVAVVFAALLLGVVGCSDDDRGDEVATGAGPDPSTEPTGPGDPSTGPGPGPTDGPADVPVTVVLVDDTARDAAPDTPGPGIARDRADVEALFGRFGAGAPPEDLLNRVDRAEVVVVGAVVGDRCEAPSGGRLVVDGDDVVLEPTFDIAGGDDACDAIDEAFVVVTAPVDAVPAGSPLDDEPTGVGVVRAVVPVALGTEPQAGTAEQVLPGPLSASDIDIDAPEHGAVRLAFVVEACAPATAELVANLDAGTVHAVAQQAEVPGVECEALEPHLVVADLDPSLADLTPVVA